MNTEIINPSPEPPMVAAKKLASQLNPETCWQAVLDRDPRRDVELLFAVSTTSD